MTASKSNITNLLDAQLFLDDTWIEDSAHVGRTWHQARKYPDPVLEAEHPWEYNCPVMYGTVLHRGERFQMWYVCWTRLSGCRVCYAESSDGVHWEKPKLGLHEFSGSKSNNIILESSSPSGKLDDISVIDDPDDSEWPLKALYWDSAVPKSYSGPATRGILAAHSRDGILWEPIGLVLPGWGDRFNAISQKINGNFFLYGRAPEQTGIGEVPRGRVVYHMESPDLKRWSKPRLVLAPDADDPPLMQFYSATAFPYEGLVLGSIERMHMSPDKLDTEIIWSRDGKTWTRSSGRSRFIEWGLPGRFDSDWINLPTGAPIRHRRTGMDTASNRLWFYYSGRTGAHGAPYPHNHGAIGLATLRIDGFCSLHAREMTGAVLTRPMTWVNGDLMVNMDPRRDLTSHPTNIECGSLRVEIRDTENQPVKGYSLKESVPVVHNTEKLPDACTPVFWKAKRSARDLKGRKIRFLFEVKDTHLYSFRAGPGIP